LEELHRVYDRGWQECRSRPIKRRYRGFCLGS
jgi:hypothetical protein